MPVGSQEEVVTRQVHAYHAQPSPRAYTVEWRDGSHECEIMEEESLRNLG